MCIYIYIYVYRIRSVAAADKYHTLYRSNWSSAYNQSFPLNATACKQRAWDEPIVNDDKNHLFTTASQRDKSRLLAVTYLLIVVIGCMPYPLLHVVSA